MLLALSVFCFSNLSQAQILSATAVEVEYSYTATFKPDLEDPRTISEGWKGIDHAEVNADHIFGILASPTVIRGAGVNAHQVSGLGAPKYPRNISITRGNLRSAEIEYKVSGRMILHKDAAKKWTRRGYVTLPIPYDMARIYREECTDSSYSSLSDYWYFYDPYRRGCEDLSTEPIARNVKIKIAAVRDRKLDTNPHFDILRGNNGNGNVFKIYMMTGFDESSTNRQDYGRRNYNQSRKQIRDHGFSETVVNAHSEYPRHLYKKAITTPQGKELIIEVHSQLASVDADLNTVSFAKFFKEAAENSDVFIYDGHSGLGANLDLYNLESKAGKFHFREGRHQVFFFNSCSSYSYYLDSYAGKKTRATIDVITTGLESDFDVSINMHRIFVEQILNFDQNLSWPEVLEKIEKPIPGTKGTYLLNVGGV